jgi:hypothetical protein
MRSIRLLAVAVLAVTLALSSAQSVFAGVTITLNVIPISATAGQSITFSGTVTPPFGSADEMLLFFFYGTGCNPNAPEGALPLSADSSGAYTYTAPAGLPVGSYSVYVRDDSSPDYPPPQSSCVDFTVTATITLVISPSSPRAGQPITFSGIVTPPFGSADTGYVKLFVFSGCQDVYWITSVPFSADSTGAYTTTDKSGLVAGSYSALAQDFSYGASPPGICVDFTVTSQPPVTAAPVGGVVVPANNLAIAAPWLAIIGLVGCVGTVVVVRKKRHP